MEKVKLYLDSNVFIFAEVSKEKIGEDARRVIRNLGKFTGVISSLIVVWVIEKEIDYPSAITVGEKRLSSPQKLFQ
jgi:predicted nucleic acid-binding protein